MIKNSDLNAKQAPTQVNEFITRKLKNNHL